MNLIKKNESLKKVSDSVGSIYEFIIFCLLDSYQFSFKKYP